jgi:hypothetical protein
MKKTNKLLALLAIVVATAVIHGCSDNPENYSDDLFAKMLSDTTYMHQESVLQAADSVAFYAHLEQPLLWPETGDTTLRRMADFYNYYAASNAWMTDFDTRERYYGQKTYDIEKEMLDLWRKMQFPGIVDEVSVEILKDELRVLVGDTVYDRTTNVSDVERRLTRWTPDIDAGTMEKEVLPKLTPKDYLPDSVKEKYDTYVGQNANPTQGDVCSLYDAYINEKQYDTKLSMLFVLMYCYGSSSNDTVVSLLKDAEQAFTSGNYSPVMSALWRAYRVVYCGKYSCPSTYCEIPNVRFNYYRRLVAYTILRHIEKNPDDDAAKVAFYCLARRENINRFGSYQYCNQSVTEKVSLFWKGSML